jgi:hypothetical protein
MNAKANYKLHADGFKPVLQAPCLMGGVLASDCKRKRARRVGGEGQRLPRHTLSMGAVGKLGSSCGNDGSGRSRGALQGCARRIMARHGFWFCAHARWHRHDETHCYGYLSRHV